ncbi:MAG TPA: hypothetical protein EYG73_03400 [Arcobacter sp.]|nr:hypothetical protein [Arcobacter sp.]
MQVDIRDIRIFKTTIQVVFSVKDRITNKINFVVNELQKKQNEVNNELNISNNFLNIAKAHEMQKQAVLAQKTAQLARALQQEAIALSSGNPVVIAAATTYVSKATYEEMMAQRGYQKARENCLNMQRRVELVKNAKYQIDMLYEQTKMQLNSLQLQVAGLTQVLNARLIKGDLSQKDYLTQDTKTVQNDVKYKNIPQTNGTWSGDPGNSTFKPDRDTVPKQPYGNKRTWGEILDEYNIDGIEFKDGEPDFKAISKGSVEINDFTTQRDDNFYQADQNLSDQWNQESKTGKSNWSILDVKQYRKEKKLTWHERNDMKSMDLVPQEVHGNIPHSGGISKAKKKLQLEEENV